MENKSHPDLSYRNNVYIEIFTGISNLIKIQTKSLQSQNIVLKLSDDEQSDNFIYTKIKNKDKIADSGV